MFIEFKIQNKNYITCNNSLTFKRCKGIRLRVYEMVKIMTIPIYELIMYSFALHCTLNSTWWRHPMEIFSALLAICAGNSPVPGEFPAQRSVTRSFDVFFHLRLNKRLSKQSWGWWFETLSRPLWRHRNDTPNACVCNLAAIVEFPEIWSNQQ